MNRIIIMGRLTADPDIRIGNGVEVARFTLAVDRRYKREGQPSADFFRCVAFGKLSNTINQYVFKGSKIAIQGEMQQNDWTDKEGKKHYDWQVIVAEMDFCESKSAAASRTAPEADPVADDGFMQIPDGVDEELPFA